MPAGSQELFEYVVVGGGSGGCVVAARLKESGAHVLLLEAGEPDNQPDIHIPRVMVATLRLVRGLEL